MYLFVKAVSIYLGSFLVLLYTFIVHATIPLATKLLTETNDVYISNNRSSTGYRFTKGFKLKKVYEHKIKRRPTRLPLILYSIDLLICIILPFIMLIEIPIPDLWTYLGFSVLTFVIAFSLWLRELRRQSTIFKSDTWLLLCEMCYMPYSPADTTLLFKDRDGTYYTWVTRNLEGFEIGSCYMAQCYGDYIEFVTNKGHDPNTVRYTPVHVLRSKVHQCGIIPATLLLLSAAATIWFAVSSHNNLLFILGVTTCINALLLMPYPLRRKLTTVALRYSCMYKDLSGNYVYVFILADRHGNNYYYQTDDFKALEKDMTYKCFCIGRSVRFVNTESNTYFEQHYRSRELKSTMPIHWITVVVIPCILICELLGHHIIEYILVSLFITLYIRVFRYISQGEI